MHSEAHKKFVRIPSVKILSAFNFFLPRYISQFLCLHCPLGKKKKLKRRNVNFKRKSVGKLGIFITKARWVKMTDRDCYWLSLVMAKVCKGCNTERERKRNMHEAVDLQALLIVTGNFFSQQS